MTEREQAIKIANAWLDFRMNSLTQMVPGDPDCDACVLARQFLRAIEREVNVSPGTTGNAMSIAAPTGTIDAP